MLLPENKPLVICIHTATIFWWLKFLDGLLLEGKEGLLYSQNSSTGGYIVWWQHTLSCLEFSIEWCKIDIHRLDILTLFAQKCSFNKPVFTALPLIIFTSQLAGQIITVETVTNWTADSSIIVNIIVPPPAQTDCSFQLHPCQSLPCVTVQSIG